MIDKAALMRAIGATSENASRARVADRLPERERPHEFMISIGLAKPGPDEDDGEASAAGGYASDDDKVFPGRSRDAKVPGDDDALDLSDEDDLGRRLGDSRGR